MLAIIALPLSPPLVAICSSDTMSAPRPFGSGVRPIYGTKPALASLVTCRTMNGKHWFPKEPYRKICPTDRPRTRTLPPLQTALASSGRVN